MPSAWLVILIQTRPPEIRTEQNRTGMKENGNKRTQLCQVRRALCHGVHFICDFDAFFF
jgi:hypothetical protein